MAVGTQDANALARQHRAADVLHDDRWRGARRRVSRSGVAHAHALHAEHGVGQVGGFFELEAEVGIGQQRRNFFHAVQSLDTALRLLGFAGLGLEACNELLQMRNLVLLLSKGVLLEFHLLGTHVFKLAVVAAVAHELACVDVQGDVGHRIQKFAVMADDDHRAFVALEPSFQPHQGVQVQVVGRFVE